MKTNFQNNTMEQFNKAEERLRGAEASYLTDSDFELIRQEYIRETDRLKDQ